ncbi:MAG: four helix bundle protein [Flavobacteriales bacterium]|uniref:four helix bundle protein n=1 Tax=Sanyastnella coralliicola TaxID=3069118 RepID=UPI0027B96E6C|nr:four helix bundle protein [Longitalea sp. SCSIO 12813]MCH2198938.1 four helix bundle protein [Flavobacteriales bacterium]
MATTYEDLRVWKSARKLTSRIFAITNSPELLNQLPALNDQIQRAAVSIASNICEGAGRETPADFKRFLDIATGSCYELRCQLHIYGDQGLIDEETLTELLEEAEGISKMLHGLREHLKVKKNGIPLK